MSTLIASTTDAAASADFTLADGESKTLFLFDAAGGGLPADANCHIEIKSDGGEYFTIGFINPVAFAAVVIQAPGTFRVRKTQTAQAHGVGSN